jgi:CheY-like chemotaxis protein
MNIVILEDEDVRINVFAEKLKDVDATVHYFDDTARAIKYLKNNKVDLLFLDHDLATKKALTIINYKIFQNTGYVVAKWLEEHPDKIPECVVLHSLNSVGRRNMKMAIKDAIDFPGAWEYAKEIVNGLNNFIHKRREKHAK